MARAISPVLHRVTYIVFEKEYELHSSVHILAEQRSEESLNKFWPITCALPGYVSSIGDFPWRVAGGGGLPPQAPGGLPLFLRGVVGCSNSPPSPSPPQKRNAPALGIPPSFHYDAGVFLLWNLDARAFNRRKQAPINS